MLNEFAISMSLLADVLSVLLSKRQGFSLLIKM